MGDFAITGEPTNLHVGVQAKGVLALRILVYGTSAHGSTPWLGDNAVLKAIDVFRRIESMPFTLESSELFDRPVGQPRAGSSAATRRTRCPRSAPWTSTSAISLSRTRASCSPRSARSRTSTSPARSSGRPRASRRRNPYVLALCQAASRLTDGESMSVGRDGASDAVAFQKAGVPGGRVRALRRRPSRPGRVGLDRLAGAATAARWWTSPAACPERFAEVPRAARRGGRARVRGRERPTAPRARRAPARADRRRADDLAVGDRGRLRGAARDRRRRHEFTGQQEGRTSIDIPEVTAPTPATRARS